MELRTLSASGLANFKCYMARREDAQDRVDLARRKLSLQSVGAGYSGYPNLGAALQDVRRLQHKLDELPLSMGPLIFGRDLDERTFELATVTDEH